MAVPETCASVNANVHIDDETAITVKEHPDEGRVVVGLGDGHPAYANLFLDLADLDRLIAVLSAARDRIARPG